MPLIEKKSEEFTRNLASASVIAIKICYSMPHLEVHDLSICPLVR